MAYRRRSWLARRALARRSAYVLVTLLLVTGSADIDPPVRAAGLSLATAIVPAPAHVEARNRDAFALTAATTVTGPPELSGYLATAIRDDTGLPVRAGDGGEIALGLDGPAGLGDEGYTLDIRRTGVRIAAHAPAGLFHGVQSLRQVLPRSAPWTLPAGSVTDQPRYSWRGASLDVARHFFGVQDVRRYLDLLALYKINVLHLHLTDDQGWRIAIRGWPELTGVGAATEIGGGAGGFYTQDEYAGLVRYAQERFITIVPEIDLPGHTNAALASYADLNCDGRKRDPYIYAGVGFSSLCVNSGRTYKFIADVIAQVAALTPGPYLHFGGDEVKTLTEEQYAAFVERAEKLVREQGKTAVGWHEITKARLSPGTVAQYWQPGPPDPGLLAPGGPRFVLSPADHTYLDMKYDATTKLGLSWAGLVEVRDAYDWNPDALLPGVPADRILGVEAPIWTETLTTLDDLTTMALPRLPAIAELGWSAAATHDWASFRRRLAAQAPRWTAMGLAYYRSPQIPWPR